MTDPAQPDTMRRLRAIAAECRDDVRSDRDRLENIEGRFGVDSREFAMAQSDLDDARTALAAAEQAIVTERTATR